MRAVKAKKLNHPGSPLLIPTCAKSPQATSVMQGLADWVKVKKVGHHEIFNEKRLAKTLYKRMKKAGLRPSNPHVYQTLSGHC